MGKLVYICCEESQTATKAFRDLGFEAYSFDIQDCSGGHPEWHFKGDCFENMEKLPSPDLIIAHPPCTFFSRAGTRHLFKNGIVDEYRREKGLEAKKFFMRFYNYDCKRICIENPIPIGYWNLPKSSQVIQPYEFGDPYIKQTCLWLKNLPPLLPTDILCGDNLKHWVNDGGLRCGPGLMNNAKDRSKSFPGIAKAMASQWGVLL